MALGDKQHFFVTLTYKVLYMSKTQTYLNDLAEIRSMMERSSRFISLSGLSGVVVGAYALVGAGVAWYECWEKEP